MAPIDVLLAHRARFLSFVRSRISEPHEAEDVLQSAYARLMDHTPAMPSDARVVPWFYRVLRNAITDRHRRRDVERRRREVWEQDPTRAPTSDAPGRLCECTRAALASLNPRYVAIIEAVDLDGVAVVEVARRFGLTPGNASVRLHRARRLLAERLRGICRHCAETACVDCHCKGPTRPASFTTGGAQ